MSSFGAQTNATTIPWGEAVVVIHKSLAIIGPDDTGPKAQQFT